MTNQGKMACSEADSPHSGECSVKREVICLSMYKLEISDGDGKGILALRNPASLKDAIGMVLDSADEFPEASQWRLLCMGRVHSIWERRQGSKEYPILTSSVRC